MSEEERFTLEQAKIILKVREVPDVKATLWGMISILPFFILLLAFVGTYLRVLDNFVTPELKMIAVIVFLFAFVKMFYYLGPIKQYTKYTE